MKKEKKKVTTISIKPSLLERCRTIDPYFNLSQEVEKTLIQYIECSNETMKLRLPEIVRMRDDVVYFAEEYCKVSSCDNGIVDVQLDDARRAILKDMAFGNDVQHRDKRQSGTTTLLTIYALHNLLFGTYQAIAIANYKPALATNNIEKIRAMYYRLPSWLQSFYKLELNMRWQLDVGDNYIFAVSDVERMRGRTINKLFVDNATRCSPDIVEMFTRHRGKNSQLVAVDTF